MRLLLYYNKKYIHLFLFLHISITVNEYDYLCRVSSATLYFHKIDSLQLLDSLLLLLLLTVVKPSREESKLHFERWLSIVLSLFCPIAFLLNCLVLLSITSICVVHYTFTCDSVSIKMSMSDEPNRSQRNSTGSDACIRGHARRE